MIEAYLYEHLKTNVPLVGGRVFANILHQDTVKPALVYTVISETPSVSLSGDCSDEETERQWEINIYADEYFLNKKVKNEVKVALSSFSHRVADVVIEDSFDMEAHLFVQVVNFKTKD